MCMAGCPREPWAVSTVRGHSTRSWKRFRIESNQHRIVWETVNGQRSASVNRPTNGQQSTVNGHQRPTVNLIIFRYAHESFLSAPSVPFAPFAPRSLYDAHTQNRLKISANFKNIIKKC